MSEMVVGSKYAGNSDCVVKTCSDTIMTHKTMVKVGYADAVGVAYRDD